MNTDDEDEDDDDEKEEERVEMFHSFFLLTFRKF